MQWLWNARISAQRCRLEKSYSISSRRCLEDETISVVVGLQLAGLLKEGKQRKSCTPSHSHDRCSCFILFRFPFLSSLPLSFPPASPTYTNWKLFPRRKPRNAEERRGLMTSPEEVCVVPGGGRMAASNRNMQMRQRLFLLFVGMIKRSSGTAREGKRKGGVLIHDGRYTSSTTWHSAKDVERLFLSFLSQANHMQMKLFLLPVRKN